MSRLFRPWSLPRLRWAKPPPPAPRTEVIRIRPVLSRGPKLARRVRKLVASGIAVYVFGNFVVLLSRLRDSEDDIVIPIPFTKAVMPSESYRGSDPEWAEFVKVSRDPALQRRIKTQLAELAAQTIKNKIRLLQKRDPTWTQNFGPRGEVKPKNWLLSMDFPSHPPPEVGTLCITIDEEMIALEFRPMEPDALSGVDEIWRPRAAARALWEASAFKFRQSMVQRRGSEAPSGGPIAPGSTSTSYDNGLQKGTERAENPSASPELQTSQIPAKSKSPPKKAVAPRDADYELWRAIIGRESSTFYEVLLKNYILGRDLRSPPPRGCFQVSGVVVLETEKAWINVTTSAWYNPKTSLFDLPSMSMVITRAVGKFQHPLRK